MIRTNALLERLSLPTTRKLVSLAGYASFFFMCFVMFSYWSFPYGRVREFLIRKVAADMGYQLSIGEIAPHWVTGLRVSELKLTKPAANASSEPTDLNIQEATIRASILPLLLGNVVVNFWLSDGTGEVDGTYEHGEEAFSFDAELLNLDVGALGIGGWLGLPLRGQASGEVALAIAENLAESDATANLTIAQLALGDGKAKVKIPGMRDGFTVERVDAGTLTLKLKTANGVVTLEQLSAQGTDLKLKGDGSLRLVRPLLRSRGDFTVAVTFTDKYKERNDRTKALFQLMAFQPEIKRATSDDGTMNFQLSGPLQTLRAVPAGTPAEAPAPRRRGRRRGK